MNVSKLSISLSLALSAAVIFSVPNAHAIGVTLFNNGATGCTAFAVVNGSLGSQDFVTLAPGVGGTITFPGIEEAVSLWINGALVVPLPVSGTTVATGAVCPANVFYLAPGGGVTNQFFIFEP